MVKSSEVIRQAREAAGLTLDELARKLGQLSGAVLAHYEHEDTQTSLDVVSIVAEACGFDIEVTLTPKTETETPEKQPKKRGA